MNKNSIWLAFLAAVAWLVTSCNIGNQYSHYETVSVRGWDNTDTVRFELGPVMESGTFQDEVDLRTTSAYPYTQLAIIVRQQVLPDGKMRIDSMNLQLTDDEGNSTGSGTIHHHHSQKLAPIYMKEGQRLAVSIYHNMKKECLPGISDLGVTITKE